MVSEDLIEFREKELFLLLITEARFSAAVREMSPYSPQEGTAGFVKILLLVLTNQIIARRFLSGINYLASLDCYPGWQTMWN